MRLLLGCAGAVLGVLCISVSCGGDASSELDDGQGAAAAGGGLAQGGGVANGGQGGESGACAVASAEVVASPVDVIFAIDQSASMGEEIDGVVDNVSTSLVNTLANAGIDYRVIFVAGVDGLPTGPNYFQAAAPVNSSDALTLLLYTYDGFYKTPNTCDKQANPAVMWRDQVRYDSHKVFVVVSDDDPSTFDCDNAASSCTSGCGGCASQCAGYCPMFQCPTYADAPAEWGGGDFASELYALEPAGVFGSPDAPKWMMHAIVPVTQELGPGDPITGLYDVCNANGNTGETSGVEYQKLAVASGGLRFPSCDTDYSPVFESIAATILPLACKFNLEQTGLGTPDPGQTNVEVDLGDGQGEQTIPRDESAPCDGGADGWQYADGGTAIVLCGATCDALKASPNATVSITVGCEAVVK